jgi:response regulator RpfG family c-di-GMP phosphodiesterase
LKKTKIIFVDDDKKVLDSFVRIFRNKLDISVAENGNEALKLIAEKGPFAVVVSDYKMPEMNGLDFLAKVKKSYPNCIRIMLTGFADLDTAIKAVNESNIFRLLTKPCPKELMNKALDDAIELHHIVMAEKELLENTVNGAVKLLVEILSTVRPSAFSRATRTANLANEVAGKLSLPRKWILTTSALLINVGLLTVSEPIMEKLNQDDEVTLEEKMLLDNYPMAAAKMIKHIPRLEPVAELVGKQEAFLGQPPQRLLARDYTGREKNDQILHLVRLYLHIKASGFSEKESLKMIKEKAKFDAEILNALYEVVEGEFQYEISSFLLNEIPVDSILAEDVYLKKPRKKLLYKGQELTSNLKDYLVMLDKSIGVEQPITVLVTYNS